MAHSDPPIPQGVVAGKYRLTRLLGRGGMGAVWEGTHISLGTRVAVKFIDAEYAESPEARSRFENEARAAARLRSKHVVEVYDHGVSEDGRPFIVMEFLQGEPLDKRLDRLGRLPAQQTAQIVLQICRALAKAHAANIVHRDLKPENVFLVWDDEEGTDVVKVVDFGIAKFNDTSMTSSSATRTGSVLGTPHYMSPEQARGLRSVDARSDLWSVAVIAYRSLVGALPFEGEAVGDLLVKLCTAPIPVPSQLAPDIPPGFDAWLEKALTREPAQRFQSAAQLSESLASVCGLAVRGPYQQDGGSGPYSALGSGPFQALTDSQGLTFANGISVTASSSMPVSLVTGAPTTQTPTPPRRPRSRALAFTALLVLVSLGVGGALAMRFGTSSSSVAIAAAPAAPRALAASALAVAPVPASASAPQIEPAPSAAQSPSPPKDRPAQAKPVARPSLTRPSAKSASKPAQRPSQRPASDIGF
ncbi:MAG TPA: serine/threonine-protein kinase [Polyangiaceae bacterium]|nr:serine/threonine-protein kinase [Polyangiaceae bacterium]